MALALSQGEGGFLLHLFSFLISLCALLDLICTSFQAACPVGPAHFGLSRAYKQCLQELKPLHNPALLLVAAYFPCVLVFFFFLVARRDFFHFCPYCFGKGVVWSLWQDGGHAGPVGFVRGSVLPAV